MVDHWFIPFGWGWAAHGLPVGCPWTAHGMPVGCPCDEQEMNLTFKSNNVVLREPNTTIYCSRGENGSEVCE